MSDDKPKFDPSIPFQETQKPPFDPNAPFHEVETNNTNPEEKLSPSPGAPMFQLAQILSNLRKSNNPSAKSYGETITDVNKGILQGATAGLAPVLQGAGSALKDVINDPSKLKDLYDLYRQHQGEAQKDIEASQKRSPIATAAGEFGGSLPTVAGAATGLSKLGIGGTQSLAQASKEGLMSLAQELTKRSTQAGIISGVGAATSSPTTLEHPIE